MVKVNHDAMICIEIKMVKVQRMSSLFFWVRYYTANSCSNMPWVTEKVFMFISIANTVQDLIRIYCRMITLSLEEYDNKDTVGDDYSTLPDLVCVITVKGSQKT